MPAGIITLLTDFGSADAFVGVMKGVVLGICPEVRLVDLTHAVPPQQVGVGALLLRSAVPFFPAGSVHVAVVDPGVGGSRRPLLVETSTAVLVGPDNGLLIPAAATFGDATMRVIENDSFFRHPVSQTFHGRDVFAPVAAHLARGVPAQEFGPIVDSVVDLVLPNPRRTDDGIVGEILHVDHFGNLITNIGADLLAAFPAAGLSVSIEGRRVGEPVAAYGAVEERALLAVVGSWGLLEIAERDGNAAKTLAAEAGTPVTVDVDRR
jgi:S-adenosylmethionine hydrolase